ncbi:FAD-dependent monooxygenase [Streptomyces sp. 184]|uniref:FAD-dependent monooxygenase n=1 Tax=Streptomyces sp. 184 TaxID=1827526 RepID=UPI003891D7AB
MDPVIIVGAGPVGLALSLALARHAVPTVLLDDRPAGDAEGDGSPAGTRPARTAVLRPHTTAFLDRLGAAEARERGALLTGWRVLRGGRTQVRVEFGDAGGPAPLHLSQFALTTTLAALADNSHHVEVFRGSRVTELAQEPYGIRVRTRAGTWWRGSWLVGCDGARSTVRKLLEVPYAGRSTVERHAVAAVRADLPWPGEGVLYRGTPRSGPGPECVARPLGDDRWRLDWLLPPGGAVVTPEALVARLEATLRTWTGTRHPSYELLDTGVYNVHHRLARRWRRGRALLAGDAAHLLGSLGTQQLEEGLADAENLAWKLGRAWHQAGRDDSGDDLVDTYVTERRAAIGARLRAADQVRPLLRRAGGLSAAVRGKSAAELLTDGHLGRGRVGGPPVYDTAPTGLAGAVEVGTAPGARVDDVQVIAPDGWTGPLSQRLGGDPLLVLVAPGTRVWDRGRWLQAGLMPKLVRLVSELPARARLLVTEAYPGAAAHTVLYIRPDGHLMAAVAGVHEESLRLCANRMLGRPDDAEE